MEAQLANASHWNGQVVGTFHRCDLMLSKYTEQVGLLLDRWRRIQGQIDMRYSRSLSLSTEVWVRGQPVNTFRANSIRALCTSEIPLRLPVYIFQIGTVIKVPLERDAEFIATSS